MVSLTMQPKADGQHLKDTLVNIRDTKEFVVNIATLRLTNAMHASSTAFAPEVDEFEAVGLRKIASDLVKPWRVADAPISMECRLEQILPMGDVNDHLVIGRIVRFHVADELALENGRIDTAALRPVGRLAAEYALIENVFACPVADKVLERRDTRMHRVERKRYSLVAVEGSGVVAGGCRQAAVTARQLRLAKIGGFRSGTRSR
jgi:flavin reductase (DIM6/NTAB) family NADH-FMN oxidoreductase RutF